MSFIHSFIGRLGIDYFSGNRSEVDIVFSFLGESFGTSFNLVIPKSSLPKAKNAIPNIKNAAIATNGNILVINNAYIYIDF